MPDAENVSQTVFNEGAQFRIRSSARVLAQNAAAGVKRQSPTVYAHDRCKKIKVIHHIRSTALLLPSGLSKNADTGHAHVPLSFDHAYQRSQSLPTLPKWLESPTSMASRESPMAPAESEWSSSGEVWSMSQALFRRFENAVTLNEPSPAQHPRLPKSKSMPPDGMPQRRPTPVKLRSFSAPPNLDAGDFKPAFVHPRILAMLQLKAFESRNGHKPAPMSLQFRKFTIWNSWMRKATATSPLARSQTHALAVDSTSLSQSHRSALVTEAIASSGPADTGPAFQALMEASEQRMLALEDLLSVDSFAADDFDDDDLDEIDLGDDIEEIDTG